MHLHKVSEYGPGRRYILHPQQMCIRDRLFTASPFLFLPHYRGSLIIIINKCTQSELEHQTGLEHVEVLVILELVTDVYKRQLYSRNLVSDCYRFLYLRTGNADRCSGARPCSQECRRYEMCIRDRSNPAWAVPVSV